MLNAICEALCYNSATGEFIWKIRPAPNSRIKPGDVAGCLDVDGYRKLTFKGKNYKGHQLAWFMYYGIWPTRQIDHKNENRDDNRISNLRLANPIQQGCNQGIRKNNTSGFKNIHWSKQRQHWQARIRINGKRIFLGGYLTANQAFDVYSKAALKHHGEFANTGTQNNT